MLFEKINTKLDINVRLFLSGEAMVCLKMTELSQYLDPICIQQKICTFSHKIDQGEKLHSKEGHLQHKIQQEKASHCEETPRHRFHSLIPLRKVNLCKKICFYVTSDRHRDGSKSHQRSFEVRKIMIR